MTRCLPLNRNFPLVALLSFGLGLAGPATAQTLDPASAPRDLRPAILYPAPRAQELARPTLFQSLEPARARSGVSPGERRAWLALAAAEHGAAFFDAHTTREVIGNYRELNPLLRPFAHSAALYPVMQLAPFGFDLLAERLARSPHRWLRRFWWVPQAAATAGFVRSGVHNMNLPAPAGAPRP